MGKGGNRKFSYRPGIVRLLSVVLLSAMGVNFLFATDEHADISATLSDDRRLLADGLYARGLYELAKREYEELLTDAKVADGDILLLRLAECLRKLQQFERAEKIYTRIVDEYPDSPERGRAQLQRALLAAKKSDNTKIVALLKEVVDRSPQEPEVRGAILYTYAEALEQTGDLLNARVRYEMIRLEQPQSNYALLAGLRLGAILARSKAADERKAAYDLCREVATKSQSTNMVSEALLLAGDLAYGDGRYNESAECYTLMRKQFVDDPRTKDSAIRLAWSLLRIAKYNDALTLVEEYADKVESTQQKAHWLYLKANVLRLTRQFSRAVENYRQVLKTEPQFERADGARYELLLCLKELKDYKNLVVESERFLPADELYGSVLWLRGEAETVQENWPRAISAYSTLADRFPDSAYFHEAVFRLAWLQQRARQWLVAAENYQRLVKKDPQHKLAPQALFAAGVCLVQAEQGEAAIRIWGDLADKYPAFEQLDEVYFQIAMEGITLGWPADKVIDALNTMLARFPKSEKRAEALYWRAGLQQKQNRPVEQIIADLKEAISVGGSAAVAREARVMLGSILFQQEKLTEAAEFLQPLLKIPGRIKLPPDKLVWLSEFQFNNQAFAEAEIAARNLTEAELDVVWKQTGWSLLGRALRAQNRPEEAMAAFVHALQEPAQSAYGAEAALRLGEMLLDAGRLTEAAKRLNEAAERSRTPELQGTRARAYIAMGRCAELQGDREGAVRAYLAVSILYDDEQLVSAALDKAATLLELSGRQSESRATATELVSRYPNTPQGQSWRNRLTKDGVPQKTSLQGVP